MKRLLLTALAWLCATALTIVVVGGAVLVLAGPHADLLPAPLQGLVFVGGWLAVLLLPLHLAQRVWRRLGKV